MGVHLYRPRVADLVFQLYERPLHPEFFDILAVRRIERPDYEVAIHITRTGHFITWKNADRLLTELADVDQRFAEDRRPLSYRLRGEHAATLACGHGIVYQMNFQVETLAPEIFLHVHEEILADGTKRGYDLEVTRLISATVPVPVIASGGAGEPLHLLEAFTAGAADAAIVASIVHYGEYPIPALKVYLKSNGVEIREI